MEITEMWVITPKIITRARLIIDNSEVFMLKTRPKRPLCNIVRIITVCSNIAHMKGKYIYIW